MELNKVIKLSDSRFDVAGIIKTKRILYFKEKGEIIIKSSLSLAMRDVETKYANDNVEILTASQAPRRYPEHFTNSTRKEFDAEYRTIMLRVPSDLYTFCCRKGKITRYLQTLIRREMEKYEP